MFTSCAMVSAETYTCSFGDVGDFDRQMLAGNGFLGDCEGSGWKKHWSINIMLEYVEKLLPTSSRCSAKQIPFAWA